MSGIRLNFIVEGQTEKSFVDQVLMPYLAERSSVYGGARCVETRKKKGSEPKESGGFRSYAKPRGDIIKWMNEDRRGDARFTTMFDLYGLPDDFPGYATPEAIPDPRARAVAVQEAMLDDIGGWRLLPYIQVHEFEALVLADPEQLASQHLEYKAGVKRLVEMAAGFESPELINGGAETAPSKRIIQAIPTYKRKKKSSGSIAAKKIGIPKLRAKCPHFNAWVEQLEALG